MKYLVAIILGFAFASPAAADWHEAQSENFVVYADDSARDVQKFAEMLERYHAAMTYLMNRDTPVPSPSNRVTIFAVGDQRDVRRLVGENATNIAGFYIPRAGGSRAFVPNVRLSGREPDFSLIVLLHEYAHHYLIGSSRYAMPRWLSEGAAEFFASSRFPSDGSIEIGHPANHRASELAYAADVSAEELLDHELYEETRGKRYDAFYGRAWALYHYLIFNSERDGQLLKYWTSVATGTSARDAAEQAFGDLGELDDELDRYVRQRRMNFYDLTPEMVSIGSVTVRKLSEGMDEAMPLRIRSQRGVTQEEALELLPEVREVAAQFPDDAGVLAVLAEAEYDAGHDTEAIAAADRAIAIDPTLKDAYVQKGLALFRLAADATDADTAYADAMKPFRQLNKLENDHPLPLIYYYRSYTERGEEPSENARAALQWAAELAPFDQGLAMNAGLMQAQAGNIAMARYHLAPLAANPHGGGLADQARSIVTALEDVDEGTPFNGSAIAIAPADTPADTPPDDSAE